MKKIQNKDESIDRKIIHKIGAIGFILNADDYFPIYECRATHKLAL